MSSVMLGLIRHPRVAEPAAQLSIYFACRGNNIRFCQVAKLWCEIVSRELASKRPSDFHVKESSRLRLLAAQTTTPRIKDRLLDLARDHERLAEQGVSGVSADGPMARSRG